MHGQSQQGIDQTRQELRQRLGTDLSPEERAATWTSRNGNVIPVGQIRQGVDDFLLDTVTDPTIIGGKLKAFERGVDATGRAIVPAAARGIAKLEKSANPELRKAGAIAAGAHDFVTFKGETKRALAAQHGAAGLDKFAGLKSINNARNERGQDLANSFVRTFQGIIKDLPEDDRAALYQAVHTATESALPARLQAKAKQFSTLTDSLAHLSGTRGLRDQLGKAGFNLPEEFQRFDTQVRSLQRPTQYRANYVPTAHELDTPQGMGSMPGTLGELDQRIAGQVHDTRSLLEARDAGGERIGGDTTTGLKADDKNLRERGDHAQLLDPEMQDKVIEARLRSGAQAISARDAEREVGRLFGVGGFKKAPAAAKAFFQETHTSEADKSFWQHLGDVTKGAVDLPKRALFALPFRHMANIGSLSIFADPSLANVFGTAGRFARIMAADYAKDPAARELAVGKAAKYGVTSATAIDRETGWTGRIPLIGDIYKTSSHILWSFDDAAKAQRFEKLRTGFQANGMKESDAAYKAANQVGAELIDYSNRSPFTQALSYIAPFATYRSKLPGAIARTAVRHPERIAIAGRVSPELVGDEQDAPNGLAGKNYLPLADTLRGVDDPWAYARSTAGYPARALATGLGIHSDPADGGYSRYANYGKPIDFPFVANAVVGAVPGAQPLLEASHLSEFPSRGWAGVVQGQTGFGLVNRPSPFAIIAQQQEAALQAAIDAARGRGNTPAVEALQKRLDTYRRFH